MGSNCGGGLTHLFFVTPGQARDFLQHERGGAGGFVDDLGGAELHGFFDVLEHEAVGKNDHGHFGIFGHIADGLENLQAVHIRQSDVDNIQIGLKFLEGSLGARAVELDPHLKSCRGEFARINTADDPVVVDEENFSRHGREIMN
ncbi:hypothetical protein QQ056_05810 [Oscillatoria laete-virens NRMC-F 0139]|nr:hypothetical protein [Oscillatoria laete-virens]MDL5053067.1 hypothetical protein [Oscillatoria laete-virens NRMC-F 0139]